MCETLRQCRFILPRAATGGKKWFHPTKSHHRGILSLNRPPAAGLISFEMTRLNWLGLLWSAKGEGDDIVTKMLKFCENGVWDNKNM